MPYKDLPEISERQYEIMDMVWKFRFINRHQIQKLFKYKDPRRLNEWLRDLVEKGYLGRIYSHKLLENTKPSIYYLMNNGINLHCYRQFDDYANPKYMKKFYEDKKASETFINHNINLCTLYQQFMDLNNSTWEYQGWTKNEMWVSDIKTSPRNGEDKREKAYLPDLTIDSNAKKGKDDYIFYSYVVELFDSYIPNYALEGKARKYLELCTTDQTDHITYFEPDKISPLTLMLILPNQRKLNHLKKYINEELYDFYRIDNFTLKLATYQKVKEKGVVAKEIWKTLSEDEEED